MVEQRGELWAITSYFNPLHYRTRLANYKTFRHHLAAPLVTVEWACDGAFELGSGDADILVQLRSPDLLWQKERLLNLAVTSDGGLNERRYRDRHTELERFGFDPFDDIAIDAAGLWRWASDKPEMHRFVANYFSERREDG